MSSRVYLQHAANSVNHCGVRQDAVIASCSRFVLTLLKIVRETESLSDLGTTCPSHQTLATNSLALLASALKTTRKAKRSTKMAERCSCRHHKIYGGGGRKSQSRVTVCATTLSILCSARLQLPAARRPPARGHPQLPVSLAPNSAPTHAAAADGRKPGK